MKRGKIRLYLDTSVISALFDERNPERQDLTKRFFEEITSFEVYISESVLAEIDDIKDLQLKNKLENIASSFKLLPIIKIATPAELIEK
jgi:predicted nucleic acid-binding protein